MPQSTIDVTTIRHELPGITSHTYLNAASFGPLLRCVPPAMQVWLNRECFDGRLGMTTYAAMGELYEEARAAIARLLHADPDEIALTGNTGEGLNSVCQGFDWQAGDEVIITDHEHISLLVILYYLRDRYGIVIREAKVGAGAEQPVEEACANLITSRTRLIVLSHVSFMTGAVFNVPAVVELAHQHNVLVLADGAQAAGVIPVDVKALGVDFYAFPMQKWLCGPDGTGGLYVRREVLDQLRLTHVGGWFSLTYTGLRSWVWQDAARRFELGGRHSAAVAGQLACLRWLEETITYPLIFERIATLHATLFRMLTALPGITIHTPRSHSSGLLTFTLADCPVGPIVPWLQHEHDIHVRAIFEHNALRVSTGFYNIEAELDHLVQALQDWQRQYKK